MLFSEKIELKCSRRILRAMIVSFFYTFYYNKDASIKKRGIKIFLKDTIRRFLIFYTYIHKVVNEEGIKTEGYEGWMNKCLRKYDVTCDWDDVIVIYIKKNNIAVSDDTISHIAKIKDILLSCIEDDTLISLLCFEDYFYLQKDLMRQMIYLCDKTIFFEVLSHGNIFFYQHEEIEKFYHVIFDSLEINFNNIIDYLSAFITNWKKDRIKLMEKIILCAAIIEQKKIHTPHSVVMNEYIDIAKMFCTTKSGKFINGILDVKDIDDIKLC